MFRELLFLDKCVVEFVSCAAELSLSLEAQDSVHVWRHSVYHETRSQFSTGSNKMLEENSAVACSDIVVN
jgi:hypothetical protein